MSICNKDEYDKWLADELWYNMNLDNFLPKDEAIKYNGGMDDYDWDSYISFDQYDDRIENYESFKTEYTTPSGDNVVVFGYHGYD